MTHSTKNAIELKCSKELLERSKPVAGRGIGIHHDACIAHALMKAIEDLNRELCDCYLHEQTKFGVHLVSKRAAEILESEFGIKP